MKRLEDLARQDREKLNELKAPGNLEAKLTDALKERTHEDGTKRKRMHPLLHATMVLFLLGGSSFLALSVIGNDSTDEEEETEEMVEEEEIVDEEEVTFEDEVIEEAVRRELHILGRAVTKDDLKDLKKLEFISGSVTSLEGLEHAQGLESIRLKLNESIDLSILEDLPNLTNLNINESDFDSDILRDLDHLKGLAISNTEINDYSFLEELTDLELLALSSTGLDNLKPITHLENLNTLSVVNNPDSNESNYIDDISPLSELGHLTSLTIVGHQVNDLSPISNLEQLNSIVLNRNHIEDLSPLESLTNLRSITLDDNQINDLTPLSNLNSLENISLNQNEITDASILGNLENMNYIRVADNELEDVDFVEKFNELEAFIASNNHIETFPNFNVNNGDFILNLSHNKLMQIDKNQLELLKEIRELDVRFNNLTDLSVFDEVELGQARVRLFGNNMNEMLRGHINQLQDESEIYGHNLESVNLYNNISYRDVVSYDRGEVGILDRFNNNSHLIYRVYEHQFSTIDLQVINLDESEDIIFHSFALDSGVEQPFYDRNKRILDQDPFGDFEVNEDEMKVMITIDEVASLEDFEGLDPGIYEWDLVEGEVNKVE
ncbi:leucine-rich repeat domain-containing protein [Alkalibacillus haloalkaliphilus]|uniref:leucine-rich repeat domain-containing protein n=1 Tax=Alkalibacillus haloalkaliphilus TaxID=94136 RepID=UPI0029361817|nr:leucine-rich repeat domain-containing protein [Alkalibacillus haloalkaliphilus]MDV2582739.1 leucine-rich repeat domain-containing protein [Alkalibacillus haloalkaliphilus]